MTVDLHTHAPLHWLMADFHVGVRPDAGVRLDLTFEEHWEALSPMVDRREPRSGGRSRVIQEIIGRDSLELLGLVPSP